jgi:hypothetical protein
MGQNGNFVGNYQSQFDLISRPKQAPINGILLTFMLTHTTKTNSSTTKLACAKK